MPFSWCVQAERHIGVESAAEASLEFGRFRVFDAFDDVELAQTGEVSGEGGGRALGECWQEVGAAAAGDIESGALQGRKQGLFGAAEEVETPDGAAFDGARLGKTVECPDAGREVVKTGEVFEIAAVAAEQNVTEVGEAIDVLFDGSEGVACWTLPMFYLAVVLEGGDVVGGGLDAQDESEFVVDLDRGLAKAMLEAGALDPGGELTADLLGELGGDFVAKEARHVFGFDGQDGLPGKLFIEGFEDGLRAEHQISGVLDLHKTPVVRLGEDVEHRTALLGVAIEDVMQAGGRQVIGEGLRPLPVVDVQKGVVGKFEPDAGGRELAASQLCPLQ
jgi:hypothetical protein